MGEKVFKENEKSLLPLNAHRKLGDKKHISLLDKEIENNVNSLYCNDYISLAESDTSDKKNFFDNLFTKIANNTQNYDIKKDQKDFTVNMDKSEQIKFNNDDDCLFM